MKYTIVINQTKAIEWNLSLSEATLFSFIYELPSWAEPGLNHGNGLFYFCSKNKVIDEFPMITSKKDTVYRLFKSLEEKALIEYVFHEGKDWVRVTEKGKLYNYEVGKKSDEPRKKIRKTSEKNPTNNTSIDNNTNNTNDTVDPVRQKKIDFVLKVLKWQEENPRTYPKLMTYEFVKYWIETNKTGKAIRYEKEQFFEIGKRLSTWFKRSNDKEIVTGWEQEDKIEPLNVLLRSLF